MKPKRTLPDVYANQFEADEQGERLSYCFIEDTMGFEPRSQRGAL
ncbi:hypothetical protein SAMN04488556_0534 [Halostagnicola kamekurae]|uniref:Uncharacterized protein n=1 Tax=Halostagnicola kamekurae TaxID=619731 RepID=A0A1I6PG76_9EURY|nr:hypothetical protein SAMN04488556_0534 [Halostagnicola kamekurae]